MERGKRNIPTDKMALIIGGNQNSHSGQDNLVNGDSPAVDMRLDTSEEELHELPAMDQDMEAIMNFTQFLAVNEMLHCKNVLMKESNCGSFDPMSIDDLILTLENTCFKVPIESLSAIAKNDLGNIGKAWASSSKPSSTFNQDSLDPGASFFDAPGYISGVHRLFRFPNVPIQVDRSSMRELVISAIQELDALVRIREPLWIQDIDSNTTVLNKDAYFETFERKFMPGLIEPKSESSRECAFVKMNPLNIVEIFMKLDKWLAVFSGIISQAVLLEVLSTGAPENYNGALQMIAAEFHALSPAIPTRDYIFLRCCKQLREGIWAVVDVSIDALLNKGPIATWRRRPSGCLIEAMPNGYSKITWIEHVEIQEEFVHSLSRSIISSNNAYGAKRWISILKQECERLASALGPTDCEDLNEIVLQNPEGKKSVFKLAERMVSSFFGVITASSDAYDWTHVYGDGVADVRIMSRKSVDVPGTSSGLIISASRCLWIPVLPKVVFDYLCDLSNRTEWDIHASESIIQEMAYFGKGLEKDNCVTILQVKEANTNEGNWAIVQETNSNTTTSFIVSAVVDISRVDFLFGGGNPDMVKVLPFGFTILPSKLPGSVGGVDDDRTTNGTLLSFAIQIQYKSTCEEAVDSLKNLVNYTIGMVKIGLGVAG